MAGWNLGGLEEQLRSRSKSGGAVLAGGPTKKRIKKANKRGRVLVPEKVVTFQEQNPEAYQDRMYGLPNAIDIAQAEQGGPVDRRDVMVQQLLQSRLGRGMEPGNVAGFNKRQQAMDYPGAEVSMLNGEKVVNLRPNDPLSLPIPVSSIGEVTDMAVPPTGMVKQGPAGIEPLNQRQIERQAGRFIKQTRKGLEQLGLSHDEAVNALSSELQTGDPSLDPQKIYSQTNKGMVEQIVNDPQFQARATIEGEILPPLLTNIDRKKGLLGELVSWENAGRPGRSPLYGYSDWLDHSYGSYDSGSLAAEISQDEALLEQRAIEEFLSGYTKEENMNEKILNMINSAGSPSPGYFQQQGAPFPQLAAVVLAGLSGGSTSAPSSSGTTFQSEKERQASYKHVLGEKAYQRFIKNQSKNQDLM